MSEDTEFEQYPEPDLWGGEPCPKCGNMLHTFDGVYAEKCIRCGLDSKGDKVPFTRTHVEREETK